MAALTGRTISSDHILTEPNPGSAVAIVHDDPDNRRRDDRDGGQRREWSRLTRRLLRRKMPPRYEIFDTGDAPGPSEAIYARAMY